MHSNRKSHLNGMKPFDCSDLMIRREKSGHWFILIRFDSICFAMNEIRMLVKSNFVIPIKRCLFRYKYWNWERHQPSCMFEWPTDKFIRTRKCSAIKMSHTYDYLLIKKNKQKKIKAIFACYLKVRYASGPSVKYAEKHSNPLKHTYTDRWYACIH